MERRSNRNEKRKRFGNVVSSMLEARREKERRISSGGSFEVEKGTKDRPQVPHKGDKGPDLAAPLVAVSKEFHHMEWHVGRREEEQRERTLVFVIKPRGSRLYACLVSVCLVHGILSLVSRPTDTFTRC